ncbi:MAG: HpcH/HpaI aldolase/citrate lyase family protein [Desulfohalobiaceae bacterium]
MEQKNLLLRSVLSVPGNREKMIAKAKDLAADMIMLDLEDSVPLQEKTQARSMLAQVAQDFPWGNRVRGLRINSMRSPLALRDVLEVVGSVPGILQVLVVPKVEQAWEVQALDWFLGQLEAEAGLEDRISLHACIETAKGLEQVREIAVSSSRLQALVFGVADFAASLNISPRGLSGHGEKEDAYPGHRWHYALFRIAVVARAHGLQVLDAPFGNIHDKQGLLRSCQLAAELGLDGKWVIHPEQIELANQAFTPDDEQIHQARQIVEAWEQGQGSLALEGSMIDQASLRLAWMTLEKLKLIQGG